MTPIAKKIEKDDDLNDFTVNVPKTFTLIVHSPFSTGFFLHGNQEF